MPPFAFRIALVATVAVAAGFYTDHFWRMPRPHPSDLSQPWLGARVLAQGESPYAQIGPERAVPHAFEFIYPMTAVMAVAPLGFASARIADMLFVAIGAGLLAWALTRRQLANPQLLVFPSAAMLASVQNVQWSPLLTAAALMPSIGFLLACKPTIGAALLAAYPSRAAVFGAGGFVALTLILWPWWIPAWLERLPTVTHMSAPVSRVGGPLLLLALLKWRRPEARLLTALACVPQTPSLYEAVPLFLAVRTLPEGFLLMTSTIVAGQIVNATGGDLDYDAWFAANGQWMIWCVYLPCLVMILRRQNEGATIRQTFDDLFRLPERLRRIRHRSGGPPD